MNKDIFKSFDNLNNQVKMYNDVKKDIEMLKKRLNTIQQDIDNPITSV